MLWLLDSNICDGGFMHWLVKLGIRLGFLAPILIFLTSAWSDAFAVEIWQGIGDQFCYPYDPQKFHSQRSFKFLDEKATETQKFMISKPQHLHSISKNLSCKLFASSEKLSTIKTCTQISELCHLRYQWQLFGARPNGEQTHNREFPQHENHKSKAYLVRLGWVIVVFMFRQASKQNFH